MPCEHSTTLGGSCEYSVMGDEWNEWSTIGDESCGCYVILAPGNLVGYAHPLSYVPHGHHTSQVLCITVDRNSSCSEGYELGFKGDHVSSKLGSNAGHLSLGGHEPVSDRNSSGSQEQHFERELSELKGTRGEMDLEKRQIVRGGEDHPGFKRLLCRGHCSVLQPHTWFPKKAIWLGLSAEQHSSEVPEHQVAEEETPKPAWEMKLWVQVLLVCSQLANTYLVIACGLYWSGKSYPVLAPKGGPLGKIFRGLE